MSAFLELHTVALGRPTLVNASEIVRVSTASDWIDALNESGDHAVLRLRHEGNLGVRESYERVVDMIRLITVDI